MSEPLAFLCRSQAWNSGLAAFSAQVMRWTVSRKSIERKDGDALGCLERIENIFGSLKSFGLIHCGSL